MGGYKVYKTSDPHKVVDSTNGLIEVTSELTPWQRKAHFAFQSINVSYKQACDMPELQISMSAENASLENQKVFKYLQEQDVPPDRTIKPTRFIHSLKTLPNGDQIYKSRLVGGGHKQIEEIDYDEVFASVVRKQSLRILIAIAAAKGMIIYHADCTTAYLNAEMDIPNYVRLPDGRIAQLLKALYGMKQSGRQWQILLRNQMENLGFKNLAADQCVYHSSIKNDEIYIAIYVDDFFIFTADIKTAENFCDDLAKTFKLKKLGIAERILGMQLKYTPDSIHMHQEKYIEEVLKKFNMSDCKPVSTPIVTGHNSTEDESSPREDLSNNLYMQVIGALLHISNSTRPDITYTVSILAAKMQSPSKLDWLRIKRLLRYLQGTKKYSIKVKRNQHNIQSHVYTDADHASCTETRRSRTGILILLGGFPITWHSKKQNLVTLSTVESEYVAASTATQELTWVLSLLNELKISFDKPIIHIDNQGAIAIAKDPVHHGRTKHIDIKYHYIREKYREGIFEMVYCPTKEQLADIFTKALPLPTLEYLLKKINLTNHVHSTEHDSGGSIR
jgi:hypothetical protein